MERREGARACPLIVQRDLNLESAGDIGESNILDLHRASAAIIQVREPWLAEHWEAREAQEAAANFARTRGLDCIRLSLLAFSTL